MFSRHLPWFTPLKRVIPFVHESVFRASGGRWGTVLAGHKMLLLTTTGRRSGKQWTVPLLYMDDGDRYVVIGSNWGGDKNPLWVANVAAKPKVRVRIGRREMAATAHIAAGGEHERLWAFVKRNYDRYENYERNLGGRRRIPLVVIEAEP